MPFSSGLVHAYLFNDQKGHALTEAEIAGWQPEQGLLWLHLDYTNEEVQHWLSHEAGIESVVADALTATETRPRCTPFNNGLLLLLRGINLNPNADPDDMVSIRLWVEKHRIISTRKRQLQSIQDLLGQINNHQAPSTAGEFIADLTDNLTWRMRETMEGYEETLADLEERVLNGVFLLCVDKSLPYAVILHLNEMPWLDYIPKNLAVYQIASVYRCARPLIV